MTNNKKIKIHVKNNHWASGSFPTDAEAVEGMGAISAHKGEHLMPTDYGVMVYRRRIRRLVKSLGEGKEPPQPQQKKGDIIRTMDKIQY